MQEVEELELIETVKTDIQTLRFYETPEKELIFTLDTFVQFKEGEDEQYYHYHLVDKVVSSHDSPKNFLILGGGDGCCARNILKLIEDPNITLVEIDSKIVELFKTRPRLTEINKDSFSKVKVEIADAKDWIVKNKNLYDIIILDFPDATTEDLHSLYSKEFYSSIINRLDKNGIISIQTNTSIESIVSDLILDLLGNSDIIKYEMPWLGEGSIVLGRRI